MSLNNNMKCHKAESIKRLSTNSSEKEHRIWKVRMEAELEDIPDALDVLEGHLQMIDVQEDIKSGYITPIDETPARPARDSKGVPKTVNKQAIEVNARIRKAHRKIKKLITRNITDDLLEAMVDRSVAVMQAWRSHVEFPSDCIHQEH